MIVERNGTAYASPEPKKVSRRAYKFFSIRVPHESKADDIVMSFFYGIKISHLLWVIGVYVAAFGLASQKHENYRDRKDNKVATLAAQLGTPARNSALARVSQLQVDLKIPVEPNILNPASVFCALFCKPETSLELLDEVKLVVSSILLSLDEEKTVINYQKAVAYGVEFGSLSEEEKKKYVDKVPAEAEKIDLVRVDLSAYRNGASVYLYGVKLTGAKLRYANLARIDLAQAGLEHTDFTRSNLAHANLYGANLIAARFSGANLADANLAGSNLTGADFAGASLIDARFSFADLSLADFTGADLKDTGFIHSNLTGANFKGANLAGANLIGVENLSCPSLKKAYLWMCTYRDKKCGETIPLIDVGMLKCIAKHTPIENRRLESSISLR